MFIDKQKTSTYLGDEIKKIKPGEVFVIDVVTKSSFEGQAFVVGDVMKSIDEMYSARYYQLDNNSSNNPNIGGRYKNNNENDPKKLQYLLVFVDEINRFIPKSQNGIMNAVSDQIMRTV